MSHIPERKEKDCLNCGTMVQGKYCQNCGQENVEPKETFWHMVTHFFYDITHFDSNFFHSIHHLIFKPGFLSREYMTGRRAQYLHPIKMYVFTSAIFFLLFFSFFSPKTEIRNVNTPLNFVERTKYAKDLEDKLAKDSSNNDLKNKFKLAKDSAYTVTRKDKLLNTDDNFIHITGRNYKSQADYDTSEASLPTEKRDGWIKKRVIKKVIAINDRYRDEPDRALKNLVDSLLHRLPYMLFLSLPLFALILRLVYIRRKQFYFADHGVFTIHLYVFSFILLLFVFTLTSVQDHVNWWGIDVINFILMFLMFFYLYKAMRKFYGQRRGKTFFKFLLVAILSLVMMLILLLFFFLFSTFTL